ncbi:nickel/cobalt transporter [Herbidospora yilanensis]|uniref:nickel/cobalt transporter n=1 Tax=Herbidospora yilanensis TaxID=354426 RepID=UPI000780A5A8|nr:hypothetical protein [Herbidospora yilanensis]
MKCVPAVLAGLAAFAALAPAALAHPLGNFTVNHYNGLRLYASHVENTAVVDVAELPTLQGDQPTCETLAAAQTLDVDGRRAPWRVVDGDLTHPDGQGGLKTTRLVCELRADTPPAGTITFTDAHEPDRIGWREITVASREVRVTPPDVPAASVSDELRAYPDDLLSSPLDQRTVTVTVNPSGVLPVPSGVTAPGPIGDWLDAVDRTFTDLIGTRDLTAGVGVLGVALALILGAGHALIPGHGKTIMAAYLAGRRGRRRDALVVGFTVTATHTAGVLVVGLTLTAVSSLSGDRVLTWLGVASGALVTAIGLRLLHTAIRGDSQGHGPGHGHRHGLGHGHDPGHGHGHGHGHDHGHGPGHTQRHGPGHTHGHGPGHGHEDGHHHPHDREVGSGRGRPSGHAHVDAPTPNTEISGHAVAVLDRLETSPAKPSRAGLIGMGIAGGLVPSPSALVVLLGAIALGRTWFGVALVLAYGAGMAATLTATGLLLVSLADRAESLLKAGRLATTATRLAPVATALIVVVLGVGLALRSLG